MNVSVYTSLFNPEKGLFDLKETFDNWKEYSDEIVIATFPDEVEKIKQLTKDFRKIKVVSADTSVEDPYFDGKLKNAALQACANDFVIQQDMDERIGGHVSKWLDYINDMKSNGIMSYMIPVIDLYKDLDSFKGIGRKWYLHRKEGCFRGVVNFAKRDDGTIDTTKSDSCELNDQNGNLVPFIVRDEFCHLTLTKQGCFFDITAPHIIHLGYLSLEKRLANNKFWGKVWSAREGEKVEVADSISKLEKFPVYKHGLKREWWV